MWLVFSIFAVLWVVSVNYGLPAWITLGLFAVAITSATIGLLTPRERNEGPEAGTFRWYRIRD